MWRKEARIWRIDSSEERESSLREIGEGERSLRERTFIRALDNSVEKDKGVLEKLDRSNEYLFSPPTRVRVTVGNKLETCLYHPTPFVPSVQPLFHGPGFIEILCAGPMRSELPTPLLSTTLPRRILYHAERPPEEHSQRADSSISPLQPDFSFIPATTHLPSSSPGILRMGKISNIRDSDTVSQKHRILIISR